MHIFFNEKHKMWCFSYEKHGKHNILFSKPKKSAKLLEIWLQILFIRNFDVLAIKLLVFYFFVEEN